MPRSLLALAFADLLPRPRVVVDFSKPWHALALALLLTWLVEWAAAAVILRRSTLKMGYAVLLINALTLPLASGAFYELGWNYFFVEGLVCVVEVPLYRFLLTVPWSRAVLISLVANVLSAGAGLLLL